MKSARLARPLIAGALILLGASGVAAQRHASVNALNGIEPGLWTLKSADGTQRRLCVAHRWEVLQVMHGAAQCEHFVMENTRQSATIRYTCPAHGHGRTTVAFETPRLMQIETSGIADSAPFSESFEARRTGACN